MKQEDFKNHNINIINLISVPHLSYFKQSMKKKSHLISIAPNPMSQEEPNIGSLKDIFKSALFQFFLNVNSSNLLASIIVPQLYPIDSRDVLNLEGSIIKEYILSRSEKGLISCIIDCQIVVKLLIADFDLLDVVDLKLNFTLGHINELQYYKINHITGAFQIIEILKFAILHAKNLVEQLMSDSANANHSQSKKLVDRKYYHDVFKTINITQSHCDMADFDVQFEQEWEETVGNSILISWINNYKNICSNIYLYTICTIGQKICFIISLIEKLRQQPYFYKYILRMQKTKLVQRFRELESVLIGTQTSLFRSRFGCCLRMLTFLFFWKVLEHFRLGKARGLQALAFVELRFLATLASHTLRITRLTPPIVARFILAFLHHHHQFLVSLFHVVHQFLELLCLDGQKFRHFNQSFHLLVVVTIVKELVKTVTSLLSLSNKKEVVAKLFFI